MKAQVFLLDGPLGGSMVQYFNPLPQVIVVADKYDPAGVRWHDYNQTVRATEYRHSPRCKCRERVVYPVNLDLAR